MATLPVVSVIITNYNYGHFLERAISSVLRQALDGIRVETIVVDDGSTDHSDRVLAKFSKQVRVIRQNNAGACAARNSGLAIARGKYVKFLDADDWFVLGAIRQQVDIAESIQTHDSFVVSGDAIWTTSDADSVKRNQGSTEIETTEIALSTLIQSAPLTSCPLHKRSQLLAVGGFDDRVQRGQEHDLHVRLGINGIRFFHHSTPVYYYRQHNSAGRISNWRDTSIAESMHEASLRRLKLAEQKLQTPLPSDLREAFAKRIWREGRECLQRGANEQSVFFFHDASEIYPEGPIFGDNIYRNMVKIFGPRGAERIGFWRTKLATLIRGRRNHYA